MWKKHYFETDENAKNMCRYRVKCTLFRHGATKIRTFKVPNILLTLGYLAQTGSLGELFQLFIIMSSNSEMLNRLIKLACQCHGGTKIHILISFISNHIEYLAQNFSVVY